MTLLLLGQRTPMLLQTKNLILESTLFYFEFNLKKVHNPYASLGCWFVSEHVCTLDVELHKDPATPKARCNYHKLSAAWSCGIVRARWTATCIGETTRPMQYGSMFSWTNLIIEMCTRGQRVRNRLNVCWVMRGGRFRQNSDLINRSFSSSWFV